jgi:dienelactone hydrolase
MLVALVVIIVFFGDQTNPLMRAETGAVDRRGRPPMGQEVVLFHSALGLRPAVREFADRLRAEGHIVHTPDSFDGEVFENLEDGMSKRDALGIPALLGRAQAAVAGLPSQIVFAGFSMGTGAAEFLAGTRPGAKGAILMHGALAPAGIGLEAWPPVPVHVHYAHGDPLVDVEQVRALEAAAQASGVTAEVHVYDGVGHLFEDAGLADHDPAAAQLMLERVLAFLREFETRT